jgi:hypothetical protein
MSKIQMIETAFPPWPGGRKLDPPPWWTAAVQGVLNLEFWSFEFVSDFGFRVSNLSQKYKYFWIDLKDIGEAGSGFHKPHISADKNKDGAGQLQEPETEVGPLIPDQHLAESLQYPGQRIQLDENPESFRDGLNRIKYRGEEKKDLDHNSDRITNVSEINA